MLFFPRADGLLMPMAGLLTCCTPCAFPCLHTVAKDFAKGLFATYSTG